MEDTLLRRKYDDLKRSWIHREAVSEYSRYTIVAREDWFGLVLNQDESVVALPTVFDEINVVELGDTLMAMCCVDGIWGAFLIDMFSDEIMDLSDTILKFEYSHLCFNSNYGSVTLCKNDLYGLYSINDRKIVLQPKYQDVTLIVSNRYLWAKNVAGRFLFIDKVEQKEIYPISPVMVYDCENAMIFELDANRVYMSNERGDVDKYGFRKLLFKNGGRLSLNNTRYNITKVCDIYGCILD